MPTRSRPRRRLFLRVAPLLFFVLLAVAHPILMNTIWPRDVYHPERGFDMVPVEYTVVDTVTDPDQEIELIKAMLRDPFVDVGDTVTISYPAPRSWRHPLGVDPLGRDVLSMLLAATGPTLLVSLAAAVTTAVVGTLLATVAAFYRGITDALIGHLSNSLLLLPVPILMIILGTSPIGEHLGPLAFGAIYGLVAGAGAATIVLRSRAIELLQAGYVDAATVSGAGPTRILTRHILPHLLPLATIQPLIGATGAVITDGFLSFLGLTTTRQNWGTMLQYSVSYPTTDAGGYAWHVLIPAGLAISLLSASYYFLAQTVERQTAT